MTGPPSTMTCFRRRDVTAPLVEFGGGIELWACPLRPGLGGRLEVGQSLPVEVYRFRPPRGGGVQSLRCRQSVGAQQRPPDRRVARPRHRAAASSGRSPPPFPTPRGGPIRRTPILAGCPWPRSPHRPRSEYQLASARPAEHRHRCCRGTRRWHRNACRAARPGYPQGSFWRLFRRIRPFRPPT